jgi:WD40 repeat protein
LWDAASGKALKVMRGHESDIKDLTFSPDGERLISISDHDLRMWRAGRIWRVGRKKPLVSRTYPDWLHHVVVVGDRILCATVGGFRILALDDGRDLHSIDPPEHPITSIRPVMVPGSPFAITTGYGPDLVQIDIVSGAIVRRVETSLVRRTRRDTIAALAIDPFAATRVIAASDDETVSVWDLENEALVARFTGESEMEVCAIGGGTIVAGERSGRMHFLRLITPVEAPSPP